jgi:hypothetical protein
MPVPLAFILLLSLSVQTAKTLAYTAPPTWKTRPAASSMRIAEFTVPRTAGDAEDAEVVIFFFGGGGGSVDANIQRWVGQFQQDPKAAKEPARAHVQVGPLKVTTVDVSGTYIAETRPGAGTRLNKPGYRMRAAVVETPGGPYFIKFTGPSATVSQSMPSFDTFLKSLRFQ